MCHSSPILTNLPFHDFPNHFNHKSWFTILGNREKAGLSKLGMSGTRLTRCEYQLSLHDRNPQVDANGRRHHPGRPVVPDRVGIVPDKDDRLVTDRCHDGLICEQAGIIRRRMMQLRELPMVLQKRNLHMVDRLHLFEAHS